MSLEIPAALQRSRDVIDTRAMPPEDSALPVRIATSADLAAVTETISRAFHEDPTWSWAFPDPSRRQEQYAVWWRFVIAGAMRYPWVFMTDDAEVASIWIPPDGTEIAEEAEAEVELLLKDLVGPRAAEVMDLLERFEAAHPRDESHFYLSLLGTDPAHAGRGLGMALLAENLELVDRQGMPAYLESSNPGNNHRYERRGFVKVGEFFPPGSDIPVTTMWRVAR